MRRACGKGYVIISNDEKANGQERHLAFLESGWPGVHFVPGASFASCSNVATTGKWSNSPHHEPRMGWKEKSPSPLPSPKGRGSSGPAPASVWRPLESPSTVGVRRVMGRICFGRVQGFNARFRFGEFSQRASPKGRGGIASTPTASMAYLCLRTLQRPADEAHKPTAIPNSC